MLTSRLTPALLVLPVLVACKTPEAGPEAEEQTPTSPSQPALDLGAVATTHSAVPLELTPSRHLAVEVGSPEGTLRFFVDTGASVSVISEELAAVVESNPLPGGVIGVVGLSVGEVEIPSLQAAVIDMSGVNAGLAAEGSPPIDGILGADFLSGHSALIDYTGPTLRLAPDEVPDGLARDLRDHLLDHGYEAVPIDPDLISFLWLEASLDGQGALGGLIDTGATATAVELSVAQSLGLELVEVNGGAATVGGALDTYATSVEQLELGAVSIGAREMLVLDLSDINDSLASVGLGPVEVLVGGDLLSEREAVVDYVGYRLFLLP